MNSAGNAQAADLSAALPTKAPPPALQAAYAWSGFYVGGHVAYGLGAVTSTVIDPTAATFGGRFSSLYGGVQGGYNYVFRSRLLLGAEADISFPNYFEDGSIAAAVTGPGRIATDEIDYIATARGRLGYAFDHWLFYATGGFAWSQARFAEMPGVSGPENKMLLTRAGWSVGLGAELAVARNWTARLEYLYDNFGKVAGVFPSGTGYGSAFDIHMLRLGLNYKLDGNNGAGDVSGRSQFWPIAQDAWNIHGQATFIEQGYPAFHSPYQGINSLSAAAQAKDTTTATAFIGVRPFDGTDIYVDPEIDQGFGLSETFGVAGFPNTEAQKAAYPFPRFNMTRVYVQQTFGLGGEQESIPDGPNQIATKEDISRLTLIAGKFQVTDFFDNNAYAHDGRTQFMNWQLYCCGSYDITMDQPGYTWGAMAELNQKFWAFRAGYFLVPDISNSDNFDMRIPDGEYISELELRYALFGEAGKLRLLAWANRANMGSYAEALAQAAGTANVPDLSLSRIVRTNYGFAANLEQAINADLGVFARASWSPGQDEILGWTDTDSSVSAGAALKGTSWGRPDDTIGVAGVMEGLSGQARAYFAAGGLGILIGDGALNYRAEQIIEAYYSHSFNKWSSLTVDYQFIDNPAYNADRGPVNVFAGRLHAAF